MDKSVFKQVHDDEKGDSFRLNVEFEDSEFNLLILKESNAWFARVEEENISVQATYLEISVDEYLKKIQEYIKHTPKMVTLNFSNNEFIINCVLENNMKVKYLSCKLEKVNYSDYVENLLEKFYTERNNSLERLITIRNENIELEKRNTAFQSKLNELIQRKKTEDEELLSNFVLLLNEKKRRIQHLNELLEAFRRGRLSVNPPVKVKKQSKKLKVVHQVSMAKEEEVSESDSDDCNTDDEKSKRPQNLTDYDTDNDGDKNDRAIPSTSKFDLFADDSPPKQLPKRIKSEASSDMNNVRPSSSKQGSIKGKQKDSLDCRTGGDTPNINFSTQDLLDNI